ncbi:glycosyltransferase family 2 protein [Candidatus Fermentibacteria bacterium]|nr:glycosyltransferase family 2 protein [Candidatus Fermentibacteria bacterium]
MSEERWIPDGVSILIPAFNEEDGIGPTIESVQQALTQIDLPSEIIVVDDGSTDHTVECASRYEGVRIVRHRRNRGVGISRNTGILAARFQAVGMLDADGTYAVDSLPALVEGLGEHHMTVGARVGRNVARDWARMIPKWIILRLACYISGQRIPDLNSGLRLFRKDSALRFFPILPRGHSWVSTITLAMMSNGMDVQFVPIDYYKRIGKSTFHPVRDTYNYIMVIVRTVMYFDPLKVFFPAGLVLLLAGIAKLVFDLVKFNDIKESDVILIVAALLVLFQGLLADLIVARTKLRVGEGGTR